VDLDLIDAGELGAAPTPGHHRFDVRGGPLEHGLDAAIRHVPHRAAQPERPGAPGTGRSEEDSLDPSRDDQPDALHVFGAPATLEP